MMTGPGGVEGIAPAIYLAHDAGIWRHVSELFDPQWFRLLMKGNGAGSIQTVEQWGRWLADSKNYGAYQGQNAGRVVFEKLVVEGRAPNLPGGTLSASGTDPLVDYVAKTGEKIQLKHSLGSYVDQDVIAGKYRPEGVDAVGVSSESYGKMLADPGKYGFTETSPKSGIAVHGEHGTRVIDSGMNSDTSKDILLKAQDHARDNLKPFDLTEHLAINSMKAAGIAAAFSFMVRGSINLRKYANGTMHGDDAVDNTVSCTLRSAAVGGVTTFVTGATMAAIGIPTAGLGLAVALPVGLATGAVVSKTVNVAFDAVYKNLMGGAFIAMARERNAVLDAMFENLEEQFNIAQSYQEELNRRAADLPDTPVQDLESTISLAEDQIARTKKFLTDRR
jgi:hypothetical protein